MMIIGNSRDLEHLIHTNKIVVVLMSDKGCNVCLAIYPELEIMSQQFPNVIFAYADVPSMKNLVSQYMVFVYPTIVIFVEGKETIRFERLFSLYNIESAINRYTNLLHS